MTDVIDIARDLHGLKGHLAKIRKHNEAARRAAESREPFPADRRIERELTRLAACESTLADLARSGLGALPASPVALSDLADPRRRAEVRQAAQDGLAAREALLAEGRKLRRQLEATGKEARRRHRGARRLSEDRDATGRDFFRRAAGVLGDLAASAGRAHDRVKADLAERKRDVDDFRVTWTTWGVL